MPAIDATEIEIGLCVKLDISVVSKCKDTLIKVQPGRGVDDPHSFILLSYLANYKLWMCIPVFSRLAVGNVNLPHQGRSGVFTPWLNDILFVSPFQQWIFSADCLIAGSKLEATVKGGRSYYGRRNKKLLAPMVDWERDSSGKRVWQKYAVATAPSQNASP